ncbi:hypothetical protein AA0113_g6901 [Alternaria arborescens]|uniref:Peptidase metallopeptidase domain-containing protein n=1 Tax=Alternaria arborescens TaxID=156630 RepID=A0A4Q4RW37_9PLEO|nr:hypothetical protein AA0113_g6901 [Alternaria arborescens]
MDGNNTFFGAAAVPAGELSDITSHNALDGADGADCATTGIREATPVPITPTDETATGYKCVTQSGDDVEAINVGLPDQVPRFKPGSVIKYISYYSGWPGGQGQLISDTMWASATDWNSRNPGVKFQWTLVRAEAAFEVVYGGANPGFVAEAFFPNKPRGPQPRQLLVYDGTFTPSGLARMRNSFQHELGHVMGLRHEHANTSDEPTPAILIGVKNPLSIMGYLFQRSIQATDIEWLRYFYTLANGTVLRSENNTYSWPIRDYNP